MEKANCFKFNNLRTLGAFGMGLLVFGAQLFAQIKIMPIGDSITWGKVNQNPPPAGSEGYRKILHERLTAESISTDFVGPNGSLGIDNITDNAGLFQDGAVIGNFLPDSTQSITAALSTYTPNFVLLHIGTNNIGTGQAVGDYSISNSMMGQLYALVKRITDNGDVDNLLICKVIPKFNTPGTESETVAFNNAIDAMLDELNTVEKSKVTVIDMWTPFFANKNTYYNIDVDKVHPNATGYSNMANIFYHYIAMILQPSYIDEFARATLGATWKAMTGVQIIPKGEGPGGSGGALQCTSTGSNDWSHIAVWDSTRNLTTVSMKFHVDPTGTATDKVGLLVGLDKFDITASGYMVWVYNGSVRIKTVVNGRAGLNYGSDVTSWPMSNLVPGDALKVSYRQAADANYFTIQKNNETTLTLRDRLKLAGNQQDVYSGLMFDQASSGTPYKCYIDRYTVESQLPDVIAPGRIYDFGLEITTNTSVTLGWSAPGNDDYIGTASSYDIRYSTNHIAGETDFADAYIVSGVSAPQEAGTKEVFTVTGLQSGAGYYFRVRAVDSWGNKGELSDELYVRTNSAGAIIETFNRPREEDHTIGPDWIIDGNEYSIDYNSTTHEGELTNIQTGGAWGSVAVYIGRTNPSIVKLVWGHAATSGGIGQGGLALMLTAPSTSADGYLLWVLNQSKKVYLYNIRNGTPDGEIDEVAYTLRDGSGNIQLPKNGDTLAVVLDWHNPSGHKFDVFVNGSPAADRSLYDPLMRHTKEISYAGIMLGRVGPTNNNNVTEFITVSEIKGPSEISVWSGNNQTATVGTTLSDSLKVLVRDGNRTPLSKVPVYFNVLTPSDASVTAPPQPTDPIQIEAESGEYTGPYYVRNDDAGASGGAYIVSPVRGGEGKASFTFYNPKDTTYYFWLRVIAPDQNHYALQFQIEQSGDIWTNNLLFNKWSSQWQWDRIYNTSTGTVAAVRLSRGQHKIILTSLHDNVKVDKILMTPRSSYVPLTNEYVQQLLTNADGIAGTVMKLGIRTGANTVQVSCIAFADGPIFTETGLPSLPKLMTKTNDMQTGAVRTPLAKPFIVTLYDEYGNKVPGIVVNFQITKGDGQISAAKDTTDSNGQASTVLTLGIQDSTNNVKATFIGYTGQDVIFTGKATSGLVRSIQGIDWSGVKTRHFIGDSLANFVRAKVLDDAGHPITNVGVTFQIFEGPGRVGKQPKMTNADGIAQDTLWFGTVAGINKVRGKVGSKEAVVVPKDTVFYKANRLAYFQGDRQTGPISDTLQFKLRVKVLDKSGQAVKSQPVTFVAKTKGFHFPVLKDSITVYTNSSGLAGTNVVLPEVCGSYANAVEARCTDGFLPVLNSPIKFTINAKSTASFLLKMMYDSVGVVREMLPTPLTVKMLDNQSRPVAGQPVVFTLKQGGGQFEGVPLPSTSVSVPTDGDGLAMVYYTLGPIAGVNNNIIQANATNGVSELTQPDGTLISFYISAKSSGADSMAAASSQNLTGTVGKPLPQPVVVKVMDRLGNGVSNDSVRFSIISGGGALNGSADTTKIVYIGNAGGVASVNWTLGKKAGVRNNILDAYADNGLLPLKNSPIRFYSTAVPDSVSILTSTIQATGPVHATDADTSKITVTLLDRYGNPVSGKRVHLEVTGGTNNFPQDPVVPTNESGKAFGYLRSLSKGEKTIRARVIDDGKWLNNQAKVVFYANDASKIQAFSGNEQTGNAGTLLRDSLVVKISDIYGNAVSFGPVQFEATGGGGSIYGNASAVSDSNGWAWTKLILGPDPGPNVVKVTSDKLEGSPLYFTAIGKLGEPKAMSSVSGNGQTGAAGEILPKPFVVKVVDKILNPVSGVDVQFSVDVGKGEVVTPQPVKTDAFGNASAFLRMDTQAGQTCWVKASNTNLSNSPQRFSATSVAGKALKLHMVSGNKQAGFVGSALSNPLVVQTTDKYDNPVGGISIKFEILSGSATIQGHSSISITTDAGGKASATVTFGQNSGPVVVEASGQFLVGSPLQFTVYAQTIAAKTINKFAGDNQKGRLNSILVDPLCVIVLDDYNNPVPGSQVYFTQDSGGGAIVEAQPVTSDSNGIASVHFIASSTPGQSSVTALWINNPVTFTIESVSNPNNPVLDKIIIESSYEVFEDDDLQIPLVGFDADGDPLTFQIGDLFPPAGAVIQTQSSTTALFRWTPNYDQQGRYKITLRVIDGRGGVDSDTTHVWVKNLNRAPVILSRRPVHADTTVSRGQKVYFQVNARDPDNDPLQYIWKVDGSMVGSDLPFLEYVFNGTSLGDHTVDCFVSDGFVSVSTRWQVVNSVEMVEFAATFNENRMAVSLRWVTVHEPGNTGFEVQRSLSSDGRFALITEDLIPSVNGGEYKFEDVTVQAGRTYYYKIVDVDAYGNRHENGSTAVTIPVPKRLALIQNYPNPFNPTTTIRYNVPQRQRVTLSIYNMMGQRVAVLADGEQDPGYYTAQWNGLDAEGNDVSAGIYLYQLATPSEHRTMKMLKLK